MKTIRLIPTLTIGLMLAAATAVSAQVKIGSNPTTIDPSNNLEVESTDPAKKVSINKNTGKVTIADGSQGAGKVLTSDAAGGATWQTPSAPGMVNGTLGNLVTVPGDGQFYSGASITFPRAGTYMVTTRWVMPTGATSYPVGNQVFINTALSSSSSTFELAGLTAEWVLVAPTAHHTTPAFRVTVTEGQTLHFWFWTGSFSGELQFVETYAVGPF
ncbi:hypothetical protein [Dyadobacter fermentans]|uniref:C1q domain-containing protein n=1 Tax=Dyadobacter fermentans (strain ATCC 700827 / DSM 18053 / CIP 107007 / KCTC 52180 / NS114) TaxID=471854 RepID=C6VZS9_DYAFD|nr:hypothetical protein [Dyadobacter fermentans]ACT93557.1 hypothetical protein Dfer_2338 [Dyadobacter fermentans DSM 18053]